MINHHHRFLMFFSFCFSIPFSCVVVNSSICIRFTHSFAANSMKYFELKPFFYYFQWELDGQSAFQLEHCKKRIFLIVFWWKDWNVYAGFDINPLILFTVFQLLFFICCKLISNSLNVTHRRRKFIWSK